MLHRGDASLARDRLDQTRLHFDFEIVAAAAAAVLKPGEARLPGAWRRGTPAIVPKAPRSHSPLLTFTDLSHEYHESSALSDSSFLFAAPPPRYRQIPNVRRRIVFLTRTPAPAERRRGSGRGRLPHLLLLCPPPRPPPTRNIKAGSMLTAPGRRPPRLAARQPCLPPLGPLLPSSSGFFAALRPPFPPLAFLAANSFDPQRVRAPTNGGNLSND